jgi:hypothetical protein
MITMHVARLARFPYSRSKQLKSCDSAYGHNASYRSHAVGRKNCLFIGSLRARVRNASVMSLVASVLRIGSRCREVLKERPNAHASRDGQDPGVVTRSVDPSASVRQCESSASKSVAIRPIRPLCKQHGVVWVTNCVRAISLQRSILQAAVAENLVESLDRLCSGFAKIKGKP